MGNIDNYFVEIYDKDTNKEVSMVQVIDGKYDVRQKRWHDAILLGDTEYKYDIRIWVPRDIEDRDQIRIWESLQEKWNRRGRE